MFPFFYFIFSLQQATAQDSMKFYNVRTCDEKSLCLTGIFKANSDIYLFGRNTTKICKATTGKSYLY